jgi:hypothetical protein
MEFNNIVIIIVLVLLAITFIIFGSFFHKINVQTYPYTQDYCPKQWAADYSGNCINPICISNNICNSLANSGAWANTTNTPGFFMTNNGLTGFNPNDPGWSSFSGASTSVCGKKNWSNTNNIDWNGVTTYNAC